jgi:hypothetical protein
VNNIKHLAGDGATVTTKQDFGPIVSGLAEVDTTAQKFAIENVGTRKLGISPFGGEFLTIQRVGTNDGALYYFFAPDPNGTISKPWGPDGTQPGVDVTLASSGAFAAGTYGVRVSARNAAGETTASDEVTFTATLNQKATYEWHRVPGAVDYVVYRTDEPGTYGAYTARDVVVDPGTGSTAAYEDDGADCGAGSPAPTNTTGSVPPYEPEGDPPEDADFTQDPVLVAAAPTGLSVGEQFFYWARIQAPPGVNSSGNRRTSRMLPKEI